MTAFYPGRPPIDAYGNGGFRFAGMSHRGSLLLLPSGVYGWAPSAPLAESDIRPIVAEGDEIDLLLLGTGAGRERLPAAVGDTLMRAGIQADCMATGHAVSTYNLLLAERRRVAAALIAVADAR
ncbi:MAG: hypothetical protein KDK89_17795 [Alphaproteobacteria bacterium]|nr:hypothetical protein [Alphaproteobacteria bacterium]